MAMIHRTNTRRRRRLAVWIAAAGCGLWLLAQAVPADAQASRTRPGGGGGSSSSASSGGSSSSSSGGGSSASSSRGGSSSSGSSRSPVRVQRTRPPEGSSGGSATVIDERRAPDRRSGGSFGPTRHHHHFGFYWPYRWGWYLGWDWWYPYGGYPYGYYGYGAYGGYGGYPYPPRGGYPHSSGPGMGALDTDVWPARTQVWIDGRYVGFVDQFDGWPRYLWLPRGTYDVVFYLDGFQTLARQYTIYPGLVIDVEDRLEPGEAVHPTELAPEKTPVRDARERAERERQAVAGEPEWRERVRAEREQARERVPDADDGGWVFLAVRPADAAVYLDGEFVGTGRELSGGGGLEVDPGSHELSVVHPGYATRNLEFEVDAGGEVALDVALEDAV